MLSKPEKIRQYSFIFFCTMLLGCAQHGEILFVDDQSSELPLTKEYQSILMSQIGKRDNTNIIIDTVRTLPEGNVVVLREEKSTSGDEGWFFTHHSRTGDLLKTYYAGNRFLGFAGGYAYIGDLSGEGNFILKEINAIDVQNHQQATIYSQNTKITDNIEVITDSTEGYSEETLQKFCRRHSCTKNVQKFTENR